MRWLPNRVRYPPGSGFRPRRGDVPDAFSRGGLPRLEAVEVPLTRNLAGAKPQEDGEARADLPANRNRTKRDGDVGSIRNIFLFSA